MNVNNVVRTITIKGVSDGVEKLTGDVNRLAAAQENVAVVSESSARRTLSVQDAWRKQTLALDDAARSYSRAASATKVADNALSEGLISQQQYAARLDLIAQKFGVVTVAAEKFARAQALSNANSAAAVNQRIGVKDDFNTSVRANDIAAYGRQLDDVRAKFNPLFAAGRQYRETLAEINAAAKTGAISERERVAEITRTKAAFVDQVGAIKNSTAVLGQNSKAVGLNRYEILNLSRQMQDVVVSLQGGQSLGVVLTQQGSQVLDVFQAANVSVRGFASQAIGWLGRFAVSTAGVVTGVGAIAASALYAAGAWSEGQREIERAMIGIGRRSGATVKDINQIASASATATGLSIDQARDAALEFVKTGAIYKDNIKAAVAVTHDFAIITGKDAKEAAQQLGAALADPGVGAEELNKKLGFLDGKTREYIITLANQNRLQEAQAILLQNLAPSIDKATQTLGPFEKAWAAVGNAASRAKNAVGSALSGPSQQDQLDQLRARREQLTRGPGIGLFNQLGNRGEIARLDAEIAKLEASFKKAAAAAADDRFKQFSVDADNAVRSLQPQITQLQAVEKALADIRRAQTDANVGGRQGLASANDPAARAGQASFINLQESAAQADRLNGITLAIASNFREVDVATAKTLINLSAARDVAAAASGAEQIHAQEVARTVQLYLEGKTIIEATAIASAERAVAEAQVNAQIENQIHALEQSTELIKARQKGTEATVKAEQAYENAIRAGADASTAGALRDATLQNERARQMERAAAAAQQEARAAAEAARRWEQAAQALKFLPFYLLDALKAGQGMEALLNDSKLFNSNQGGKSQFNPEGYQIKQLTPLAAMMQQQYGPGGVDQNGVPNAQGMQFYFDRMLQKSGSYSSVVNDILSGSLMTQGQLGSPSVLDSNRINILNRAINLLPQNEQVSAIQREIGALQALPASLETGELIKSLNDKLQQLTQATQENTSATQAITDVLSPFYSSDPRRTHLGFRAFAGGGIMTPYGELPLKQYDGGGIATSPQVAVFAENRVPEAYVPVPSGRIPVELRQPANSNQPQRPISVIVNVMGGGLNRDEARKTGFQIAQEMRRRLG